MSKRQIWSLSGSLVAICLLAAACGGGSSSSATTSEADARKAANTYVLTVFGLLSGSKTAQNVIDIYSPDCRAGVKAADIDGVVSLIKLFAPDIANLKIEDVDLGKLKVETDGDNVTVTPLDPNNVKLKVAGKFVDADDYLSGLGFNDDSGNTISPVDPVKLVRKNGKLLVADCEELQSFSDLSGGASSSSSSSSSGSSSSGKPSATATVSNAVGASRTNPVPLGQSATVEKKWQVTVLKVDKNAGSTIQAANRFATPPASSDRFILINVRVKNVGSGQSADSISDFDFKLTGSKNELYDGYSDKTSCGIVPTEVSANLFPGGQTEGNVCYRVGADETGLELVWQPLSGGLTFFKLE